MKTLKSLVLAAFLSFYPSFTQAKIPFSEIWDESESLAEIVKDCGIKETTPNPSFHLPINNGLEHYDFRYIDYNNNDIIDDGDEFVIDYSLARKRVDNVVEVNFEGLLSKYTFIIGYRDNMIASFDEVPKLRDFSESDKFLELLKDYKKKLPVKCLSLI